MSAVRPALAEPLARCARGESPANVALMLALIEATDPDEVEAALAAALAQAGGAAAERLAAALAALRANPDAFALTKAVLADVEHGGEAASAQEGIARWVAVFDRAAAISPEAGVALYSLGSPELLRAATDEIVATMSAWGLLGPDRVALDIGCGSGRMEEALAPHLRAVVGLDVSLRMLAVARRRCPGNVLLARGSGRDLAAFGDGSFDLVLAVDSFPYLVQAGPDLAARHVAEAFRVLRPGGDLLILNFSYRGPEADRDLAAFAAEAGLMVRRAGERPFALWDAAAFHLAKG
jgi:SAM-dependent methyltransferase